MKKQFVLLAIMLSFCLHGCGFYVPRLGSNVEIHGTGTSLGEIDNFLEIGKTSKQEVQEAWGYPHIKMHDRNIWIYRGLKSTGFLVQAFIPWDPASWGIEEEVEEYSALFVKFDDNDHVKRYELRKFGKGIYIINDEVRQKALEWDN